MKRVPRPLLFAMLSLALLILVVLALMFRPTFTLPVRGGVASLERLALGGERQAVLIRGDPSKPILLFLHGGPGMPSMFLAHRFQRPLERDFLVVQWDRRGAGKSYREGLDPRELSTGREMRDAVELIGLLQGRYGRRPVVVVGHSYGSWLGVALTQTRPDLVASYVGVGQTACTPSDERRIQDQWLSHRAEAARDEKTLKLSRAGGDWDRESALFRYGGESRVMDSPLDMVAIGLAAPEYNGWDVLRVMKGVRLTHANFRYDGPSLPLWESANSFVAPIYLFVGRHDYVTPASCTARYFDAIRAPAKRLVWFANSAHFPFLDEPEQFHKELIRISQVGGSHLGTR